MQVFEYCVIHTPKEEKKGKAKAEIIVKPTCCIADEMSTATVIAARSIPDKYVDCLDECQVVVRPF